MPDDKKYHSNLITDRFLEAMDIIVSKKDNTAVSFGEAVGMTSSNINRIRINRGEYWITLEAAGRLIDAYGVSSVWLMTGKGEMFANDVEKTAKRTIDIHIEKIEQSLSEMGSALEVIKNSTANKSANKKGQ